MFYGLIINGEEYPVARTWTELTHDQKRHVLQAHLLNDPAQCEAEVVCALFQPRQSEKLRDTMRAMSDEQLSELFLFAQPFLEKKLDTTQHFPGFALPSTKAENKCNIRWYVAPLSRLDKFGFSEFIAAYHYLTQALSGDEKAMWLFFAVLYRPERVGTTRLDKRERYDEEKTEKNAEFLKQHIAHDYVYAAMLFFLACMEHWRNIYPDVFSAGGENPDPFVWLKVLRKASPSVAEMEANGNVEASLMFFDLNERIQEAQELQKQYDNSATTTF